MLTLQRDSGTMKKKYVMQRHALTDDESRNTAPYRLRVISAMDIISCNSLPGGFEVGENTTGAQSRNVDIKVDCRVRARC
jgi:hypothetical protein